MNTKIEISIKTILFTVALLVGFWLVIQIRDILFLLFIAFLLMTAIYPLVVFLERFRIPRAIGILLVYIVVIGFFGLSLVSAVPALIAQSTKLTQVLPTVVTKILPYWNIDFTVLTQQVAPLGENLLRVTFGIFSNIASIVTILVFTFYFLLERRHAEAILKEIIGDVAAKQSMDLLRVIECRLGSWVRGELLLMTSVTILSYIGLTILRVDFALPLAILAGLLELVPMIGPTISAIPAVLVALAMSPFLALCVIALYFIVQQVENNLLVPAIMKKSVGFSPIITIVSLLIGGRLAGIVGAILSVPVVLVLQVVVSTFMKKTIETPEKIRTKNPSKA
ncbi:hypothetical protein A2Z00_05185 [Candidatus Gottesmanbacteria bacterium RBG_13_45_10]|uniref:AI-2E family transporter n=1 Tax=Candidatus Gottesmanbacteria bacterium RBG_13_45_10 TaxID=1798370 RepID=A0A1F5ZH14_9BACT|nr:MAG: hypothetical protein A2Z00_05185 [Candidatus Gottesmanbacteria bacterium RBG_13_45_10]